MEKRETTGARVAPASIGHYKYEDINKLADLVGNSNLGVKFHPYLSAEDSAKYWLSQRIAKAKDEKEKAKWQQWAIQKADLDNNKNTPDNIITLSDKRKGKIRAIDGYELVPRETKEITRNYYQTFPRPEDRQTVDDKTRRKLKQWYRKNPTPAEQLAHPFESFEPSQSPYQMVRGVMTELFRILQIKIHSKNSPGNISAPNYMTLLQKLTAIIHPLILTDLYGISQNYDFKEDPLGYKTRKAQKNTTKLFLVEDEEGIDYLTRWTNYNTPEIALEIIPRLIEEIDNGREKITSTVGTSSSGKTIININDKTLEDVKEKIAKKEQKAISDFIMSRLKKLKMINYF
jgi:hypothetical protein